MLTKNVVDMRDLGFCDEFEELFRKYGVIVCFGGRGAGSGLHTFNAARIMAA